MSKTIQVSFLWEGYNKRIPDVPIGIISYNMKRNNVDHGIHIHFVY